VPYNAHMGRKKKAYSENPGVDELREISVALDHEVRRNEEAVIMMEDKNAALAAEWHEVLNEAPRNDNGAIILDIPTLQAKRRDSIENEFDIVYRNIKQALTEDNEDYEFDVRLKNCIPIRVRDIGQADIGRPRQISGIIIRFDEEKRFDIIKDCWQCERGHLCRSHGPIKEKRCTHPTRDISVRGKPIACGAPLTEPMFSQQVRRDMFAIRVEELDNPDDEDELKSSGIEVFFEGTQLVKEVISAIQSNDRHVRINGIVKLISEEKGTAQRVYIHGMNIEQIPFTRTKKFDELVRRPIPKERMRNHVNKLIRSFAPEIAGRTEVKKALMCLAVGGVAKVLQRGKGQKSRGELQILLLGSPGTGKTAQLKYMEQLRDNSIYVSGRHSSAVGLTVGVNWSESPIKGVGQRRQVFMGVYALAMGGVALVDELHKRKKEDLEYLASAMDEDQEIILSKQGVFTEIKINCASLHAANPRSGGGLYDPNQSLMEQMDQQYWLHSRYDFVMTLSSEGQLDRSDSMKRVIAEAHKNAKQIIPAKHRKGRLDSDIYNRNDTAIVDNSSLTAADERSIMSGEFYPLEYMKSKVEYLRETYFPVLPTQSPQWHMMIDFWDRLRKMKLPKAQAEVFDNRKINSIERTAQAIAKLWESHVVEIEHMEEAIDLFRTSLADTMPTSIAPNLGFVRFARWLVNEFFTACLTCDGRGCDACDSVGGRCVPVTLRECSDYPDQQQARDAWNYLIFRGALTRMEESDYGDGETQYMITRVCNEIAQGQFRENEEMEIAEEAARLMESPLSSAY
jgi:DNA replicative helicase MCM subunit Mcm2 (Cdc46/Mcm family)